MKKFYCANCGEEIKGVIYTFLDNFLQAKYFDDNKSNRFCSKSCAFDALCGDILSSSDLPLDNDEMEEDSEE